MLSHLLLAVVASLGAAGASPTKCPEHAGTGHGSFFMLPREEQRQKFQSLPVADQLDIALEDLAIHEPPMDYGGELLLQRKLEAIEPAQKLALCSGTTDLQRVQLVLLITALASFTPEACTQDTVALLRPVYDATRSEQLRNQIARYTGESRCVPVRQAFKGKSPVSGCPSPFDHDLSELGADNVQILVRLYLETGGKGATPVVGSDCGITWREPAPLPAAAKGRTSAPR